MKEHNHLIGCLSNKIIIINSRQSVQHIKFLSHNCKPYGNSNSFLGSNTLQSINSNLIELKTGNDQSKLQLKIHRQE